MTAALETSRTALAEIHDRTTDGVIAVLAMKAIAEIDGYLKRARHAERTNLLADIDIACVKKAELLGGGGVEVRARFGAVEVDLLYCGDEEVLSDSKLLDAARAEALDSLRVEIVRRQVAAASDQDILEALDAAERGGDDEVGEIKVAAHDRCLRCLS